MNPHGEDSSKVALVEDEPSHALLMSYNLEIKGKQVILFEKSEDFLDTVKDQTFDLIIINVNLFNSDGLQLCQQIKNKGILTPILFVTTSPSLQDCCNGTKLEYIVKPFSIKEFIQKVDHLLLERFVAIGDIG